MCSVRLILVSVMSMTEHFVSCNTCPRGRSFMMMLQSIWDLKVVKSLFALSMNSSATSAESFIILYPGSPQFHVGSTVLLCSVVHLGPRAAHTLNTSLFFQISGIFLTRKVQWVGCQGSRPELRGYSCSLWKLFHTLTVQAALRPKALMNTGEQQIFLVWKSSRNPFVEESGCRAAPAGVRAWLRQEALEMC